MKKYIREYLIAEGYNRIHSGPYYIAPSVIPRLSHPTPIQLIPSSASHSIPTELASMMAPYLDPWTIIQLRVACTFWNRCITRKHLALAILDETSHTMTSTFRLLMDKSSNGMLVRRLVPPAGMALMKEMLLALCHRADYIWVKGFMASGIDSGEPSAPKFLNGYIDLSPTPYVIRCMVYSQAMEIARRNGDSELVDHFFDRKYSNSVEDLAIELGFK